MKPSCTRRLEFDAAHRVMLHESKCRNLHGHRYAVEITVEAESGLDALGRVVDFGVIKSLVGGWIDEHLDHGTIANEDDTALIEMCRSEGWRLFTMEGNPTAENLVKVICIQAKRLLKDSPVAVSFVRLFETPNCWADHAPWERG